VNSTAGSGGGADALSTMTYPLTKTADHGPNALVQ
jgi:hypothetical protein